MTVPPDWHIHNRALLILDELHRVGFEQLRFDRTREAQSLRLHLYPARYGMFQDDSPMVTFSYHVLFTRLPQMERVDPEQTGALARKWPDLLSGPMKPRHLAGEFILDFPELLRPAYGPDHEYRPWFRHLRPHLQQGRLPLTFDEDFFAYGIGWDSDTHSCVCGLNGYETLLPAAPANPFIEVTR